MKLLKLNTMTRLFTCLLFIFLSTTLFAQNDKLKQSVIKEIENLNSLIISEDEALALTEDQKTKMIDLTVQKRLEVQAFKKSDKIDDNEVLKAIQNKYNVQIFNETLSKEQKAALKNARKKKK